MIYSVSLSSNYFQNRQNCLWNLLEWKTLYKHCTWIENNLLNHWCYEINNFLLNDVKEEHNYLFLKCNLVYIWYICSRLSKDRIDSLEFLHIIYQQLVHIHQYNFNIEWLIDKHHNIQLVSQVNMYWFCWIKEFCHYTFYRYFFMYFHKCHSILSHHDFYIILQSNKIYYYKLHRYWNFYNKSDIFLWTLIHNFFYSNHNNIHRYKFHINGINYLNQKWHIFNNLLRMLDIF